MRRLAWGLCAASLAMLAAGWALLLASDDLTPAFDLVVTLALVTFPVVGALVASRRPDNPIGWLFCVAGVLFAAAALADGYATFGLQRDLAGGVWAAWLGSWLFLPPLFGTPALLFLLFPDGRVLSPGWRWAVGLVALGVLLQATGAALLPGELVDAPVDGLQNPAGVHGSEPAAGSGWAFSLLGIVLGAVSLVLRFRRSRGEQRLQLKWFALAGAVFAFSCLGAAAIWAAEGELTETGQLVILAAYAAIPAGAGIAILRHRLYDVDLVIRRTLVYAALTATLAAAYLGSVLLTGLAIGESDLAIAAATLAVAALFRPARTRIQAAVDHRFYRSRYDAARTLEAFGGRLREQVDLDALAADLRGVTHETMQPAHVSLWLRSTR